MNFVDTALTLLQEFRRPMAVEELCDLAMDRGLLDKPGANPLRSMKTRLTVELKKGESSRLQRTDDETWRLCEEALAPKAKAKAKAKPKAAAKPKAVEKKAPKTTKAKAKPAKASVEAKPKRKTKSKKDLEAASALAEDDAPTLVMDEPSVVEDPAEPPVELTAEEKALVDLYSAESEGTMSAAVLNEYRDGLTGDEDRLMLPEIKAERRPHRRERPTRERRKRRNRGEKPKPSVEKTTESSPAIAPSSPGPRDIAGTPIHVISAQGIARERLTRSALQVLSTLPAGQTMPVRQLTQTMIRQGLLEGSPDQLWRMVKGTLLVSEQRRITRGLVPIVRYHGKDLFSASLDAGRSVVEIAASALNKAAEDYIAAVENELLERLANLAPPMLERVIYVYLQATGWTEIQWIKRVQRSSYATATAPGAVDQTMISVRSGPDSVDRRGIGELQAGLHAKGLSNGFLVSPCELSEDAETQLAAEGAFIRVLCGRDVVADLIAREVGVTWQHIQLPQIDQRFFDAVLG